jgi:hypothetical protein
MRLLCPFCQKQITVADIEAGKSVECPLCHQTFPAPYLHVTPPSSEAPVTTGTTTEAEPAFVAKHTLTPTPTPSPYTLETNGTPPITPPPAATPTPRERPKSAPNVEQELSGLQTVKSFPIELHVVRWIPALALTVIFILSFFSWVGMYPGGYPAYTQHGWQGLFADLSHDPVAEDEWKLGADLRERLKSSWCLLPYFLLLLPTLVLAWMGPILTFAKPKLPPIVEKIVQYRSALLAVLAFFMLLAIGVQWARGFGLEHAVYSRLDEKAAEAKTTANTPDKLQRWEMKYDSDLGAYNLRTTTALRFVFWLHVLALIVVAIEAGLQLRGNKPAPRVGVMW